MGSSDAQELKYLSGQKPSSPLTAWGPAALSGHPTKPLEMPKECYGCGISWGWPWQRFCWRLPKLWVEKSKCLLTYGFVEGAMMCKTTQKWGQWGLEGCECLCQWFPEPKLGTTSTERPRRRRKRWRRRMQAVVMEPSMTARPIKRAIAEAESTNTWMFGFFFHKWDEIPRLPLSGCLLEHRQHYKPCPWSGWTAAQVQLNSINLIPQTRGKTIHLHPSLLHRPIKSNPTNSKEGGSTGLASMS